MILRIEINEDMALGLAQGQNLVLRFHVASPSEVGMAEFRKVASFGKAGRKGSREISVAKSGLSEGNRGEWK